MPAIEQPKYRGDSASDIDALQYEPKPGTLFRVSLRALGGSWCHGRELRSRWENDVKRGADLHKTPEPLVPLGFWLWRRGRWWLRDRHGVKCGRKREKSFCFQDSRLSYPEVEPQPFSGESSCRMRTSWQSAARTCSPTAIARNERGTPNLESGKPV